MTLIFTSVLEFAKVGTPPQLALCKILLSAAVHDLSCWQSLNAENTAAVLQSEQYKQKTNRILITFVGALTQNVSSHCIISTSAWFISCT